MLEHYPSNKIIAGCDEAGRGSLAGPVVAAAVILPKKFKNKILNDSKLLSEKQRDLLRPIIEKQAKSWGIGVVSPTEIDRINILNASFLAMHRAINKLNINPELLLIDGNRFNPYEGIRHKRYGSGDGTGQLLHQSKLGVSKGIGHGKSLDSSAASNSLVRPLVEAFGCGAEQR